jgi:hypothetical protein
MFPAGKLSGGDQPFYPELHPDIPSAQEAMLPELEFQK